MIAKRVVCLHLTNVRLCCWNNFSIVCFNTRTIFEWQIIRNHNCPNLNWGKLIGHINSINDSNLNTYQSKFCSLSIFQILKTIHEQFMGSRSIQGFALIRAVMFIIELQLLYCDAAEI